MGRIRRAALLLLAAALLALSGCAAGAEPARHKVALVAKSTHTEFWLSVFAGAEAAAAEYNLELTTMGPATEEDYQAQNQMIAGAVANGAEALVFSAIDFTEKLSNIAGLSAQYNECVVVHKITVHIQVSAWHIEFVGVVQKELQQCVITKLYTNHGHCN